MPNLKYCNMSRLTNQQQRDILERLIGGYLRVTEQMAVKPENVNVKMLAWQWGYKALSPAKVDLLRRVLFGLSKHRSEIRRRGGIPEKEDTLNYVYIRMKVTSK